MRRMHHYAICLLSLSTLALVCGCGGGGAPAPEASIAAPSEAAPTTTTTPASTAAKRDTVATPTAAAYGEAAPKSLARPSKPTRVRVQTTLGAFVIELTPDKTPMTVDNFLRNYVDAGFYKGTIFHYVEDGFMVAGGGFTADEKAKETRSAISNEAHKGGSNVRGAVAMARDPQYIHSSTSQFLINLADNTSLDHKGDEEADYGYCVFGSVVSGMEVIDQIAKVKVQDTEQFPSKPVEPVVIQSIERVE